MSTCYYCYKTCYNLAATKKSKVLLDLIKLTLFHAKSKSGRNSLTLNFLEALVNLGKC